MVNKVDLKKNNQQKNHNVYEGKDLFILHLMLKKKKIKYSDNAEEHVLELGEAVSPRNLSP